jgi:methyl-accepting chemotaxis protein
MRIGLRPKILAPILAVVVLSMILASLFSAKRSSDQMWNELLNSSQHLARNLAKSLGLFVGDFKGMIVLHSTDERLVRAFAEPGPEAFKAASETMAGFVKTFPAIQGAVLLDRKGTVVVGSDPTAKGNFGDRGYFKKAIAGETNVSEPLISRVTGKPVFMVATPMRLGGEIVGILYLRVDLATFTESLVAEVRIGEHGYAFLADHTGLVFSHPDPELPMKFKIGDTPWGKEMLSKPAGVLTHEFKGAQVATVFTREKVTDWVVALVIQAADIEASSARVRNASLMASLAGMALVSLVVVLIVGTLLKGLGRCVDYAGEVASGRLDHDLDLRRTDELGRLADSLRALVASLRDMIASAEKNAHECSIQAETARTASAEAEEARTRAERAKAEGLSQAAQRLEGVVAGLTGASEELSAQISESSQGAQNQADRTAGTATAMEEMNATVLEVARNAANASDTTDQARGKARHGAEAVSRVVESIARVQTQALGLKTDMNALGQKVQDIGRIMNVITDIADQTNLLALNAAIEAARAGDAGRGFAVVADEVRKLAEKTMTATKEVGEAISGIQEGARVNVENVDLAARTIQEATGLAGESGQALSEIVSLVENASDQVRSIATAAEEQSATTEEINRSIEQVNRISAETSQAMSRAAEAVAGLARQTHELTTLIAELEGEGNR